MDLFCITETQIGFEDSACLKMDYCLAFPIVFKDNWTNEGHLKTQELQS